MDWDEKVDQELKWNADIRDRFYNKAILTQKRNLLEIGCGYGELLKEIGIKYRLKLYGIEKDPDKIRFANQNLTHNQIKCILKQIDILNNEFDDEVFDVILTNFYFVWMDDLEPVFTEIYRLLKNKGILLMFNEPDYGGLIEFPNTNLKKEIKNNIQKKGGDPKIARKLNQFFINQFSITEHLCTSFPWIPNMVKEELFQYLDFFSEILNPKKFNSQLMKDSIEKDKYFLFLPYFSYYLKKE